jgi:hypothetical protein
MGKYRKKPVVIDAFQYTGVLTSELDNFLVGATWSFDPSEGIKIATLEGVMKADPYDWIIKGVKGEFYPCKPDIFDATYEKVE